MSAPLLVIRLSALGDVIHTIPAVIELREHMDVEWVVERPYAELVASVAGVRVIPVSLKRWSLASIREAREGVRGPQIAVDFQGLMKSALLMRASGARERFGFSNRYIRERGAGWFVNRPVDVDPETHVVDWNRSLARAVLRSRGVTVNRRADLADRFRGFAAGPGEPGAIVLLPGAGRPEKIWPTERFADVARAFGDRATAVWGPGEEERAREIGCRVAPATSLRELTAMLAAAAVVVGGDTGPLHLAAALGAPTIGLYGPTDPGRNGPYGQIERCLSTFRTSRRMDGIEPAEVTRRIREVIG